MSMTKRYLDTLPKEQQDDILGIPPDEWTDSADNEREVDADYEAWWAAQESMGDEQC